MSLNRLDSPEVQKEQVIAGLDGFQAQLGLAAGRIPKQYRLENGYGSHNSRLMTDKFELIGEVLEDGSRKIDLLWDTNREEALKELSRVNDVVFQILEGFYVGVKKYHESGRALIPPKYVDYAYCDLFDGFIHGIQPILKGALPDFTGMDMTVLESSLGNLAQRHNEARQRLGLPAEMSSYEIGLVHAEDAVPSDESVVEPNCEDMGVKGVYGVSEGGQFVLGDGVPASDAPDSYWHSAEEEKVMLCVDDVERTAFLKSTIGLLACISGFATAGVEGRRMQQVWWGYIIDAVYDVVEIVKQKSPGLLVGLHRHLDELAGFDSRVDRGLGLKLYGDKRLADCVLQIYSGVSVNSGFVFEGYIDVDLSGPMQCAKHGFVSMIAAEQLSDEHRSSLQKELVPDVFGDEEGKTSGEVSGDVGTASVCVAGESSAVVSIFGDSGSSRVFSMPAEKPKRGWRKIAMAVAGVAAVCAAALLPNKLGDSDESSSLVSSATVAISDQPVRDVVDEPIKEIVSQEVKHYETVWDAAEDMVGDQGVSAVIDKTYKILAGNLDVLEGSVGRMENNPVMYGQLRDMVASYGGWVPPSDIKTFHQLDEVAQTGTLSTVEVDTFWAHAAAGALEQEEIDLIVERTTE